jgi:hypothetical protein
MFRCRYEEAFNQGKLQTADGTISANFVEYQLRPGANLGGK